jgi:prepilin signal peptidase PulO-like enzyme (type II secretory pathway)
MDIVRIVIGFLYGLALGSFSNVLIDRLPNEESIVHGRSHCDHCKKILRWYELIPLVSFIIQKGKCRRCHVRLSWQYPLIEFVVGIGVAAIVSQTYTSPMLLIGSVVVFLCLMVITVADLKYEIIPDETVALGLVGIVLILLSRHLTPLGYVYSVLSGTIASLAFLALYIVTRGRGMGFGDVKLVFLLGLFLGFPGIVIGLYAAFLTGAIVGVILILVRKRTLKSHVPFGPFLILGSVLALMYRTQIVVWWRSLW